MIFIDVIKKESPELWVLSQQKDIDAYVSCQYTISNKYSIKKLKGKSDSSCKNYIVIGKNEYYLASNQTAVAKKMQLYKIHCNSLSHAWGIFVSLTLQRGVVTTKTFDTVMNKPFISY